MAHDHEDPIVRTDGAHTSYHTPNAEDPYAIQPYLALGQMGEDALPRGCELSVAPIDEGVADGADPDWWASAFAQPSRPGNSSR